jgi:SAM-dependent methyltransferase
LPTVVCDVTKEIPIEANSVDFIYSNNCFEHIAAPWLAATQMTKILKPGGFLYVSAPWSWRYHPVPIDFWRFSPQALSFLFSELETLQSGFNTAFRRDDIRGFWPNRMDAVPVDEMGGWRENWLSFVFCRKRTQP